MDPDANFFPCLFCIIDLAFTQSGPGCEFFSVWRAVAVPSRAVDFFARPGTRAASSIAASSNASQVTAISYLAAPHSCCPEKASSASLLLQQCFLVDGGVWGGSFCAIESVAIGSGRRCMEGRCSRWSPSRLRSAADGGAWRARGFCR